MVLFSGSKPANTNQNRKNSTATTTNGEGAVGVGRRFIRSSTRRTSCIMPANSPNTNPIAQLYEIGEQVGTGGLGWKIFNAKRFASNQDASVFFFDKSLSVKVPSKCQRSGRATLTDLMRYDATQMQTIRHSRILKLIEPIKENGESLAFATEPILGCLSELLTMSCYAGDQTPSDGESFRLEEMEIKCGILQITEALAFLHSGAAWLHMAVSPENIYVTKWGSWKLAGFFFAEKLQNGLNRAPNVRWTALKPGKCDVPVQPNLNFVAPECLVEPECTPAADIFSLAATICTIYKGNAGPLIESNQTLDVYSKQLLELEKKVNQISGDLGPNLKEAVLKMLSVDVKQRPSAQLFLLIKFFNDQGMLCLRLLEDVQYADTVQKVQFYCSQLKESLCLIPEKLWFSRILPRLAHELEYNPDLASAIVKPLLYMLQHCSNDHVQFLRPVFKRVIKGAKLEHGQLISNLMEHVEMVMTRVPEAQTPLVYLVLAAVKAVGDIQTQDSAISCLPKMKPFLTKEYVETKLYPLLGEIFANAPSQLQARALESLSQMLSLTTEKALVEFLNSVASVQLEDAQVAVALAKFYDTLVQESSSLGISAECVATLVLPSFTPLMASTKLNQQQLASVVQTCQTLLNYVAEKKLGSSIWRPFNAGQRTADTFLQVPTCTALPTVRPQRHSIGGGVLPQVLVTSPTTPHKCSLDKHCEGCLLAQPMEKTRKFSTMPSPPAHMGSDNFLSAPHSHPTSPHIRRHSVNVPARPNSFTNLSHNIACMLPWRKKS